MPRKSSKPPEGSAFDAGLRLLAQRDHSSWEVRQKLLKRGYPEAEVAAAEARLIEKGLLGDRGFAFHYVRRRSRTHGLLAISAELAARRVDRETAEAALARVAPHAQVLAAHRVAGRLAGSRHQAPSARVPDGRGEGCLQGPLAGNARGGRGLRFHAHGPRWGPASHRANPRWGLPKPCHGHAL